MDLVLHSIVKYVLVKDFFEFYSNTNCSVLICKIIMKRRDNDFIWNLKSLFNLNSMYRTLCSTAVRWNPKLPYYDLDNTVCAESDIKIIKPYINHLINTSQYRFFGVVRLDKNKIMSEYNDSKKRCVIYNYNVDKVDEVSCKIFDECINTKNISFYERNLSMSYLRGIFSKIKCRIQSTKLKNFGKWARWIFLKEVKYRLDEEEKRILLQPGCSTLSNLYEPELDGKGESVCRFVNVASRNLVELYLDSLLGNNRRSLGSLEVLLGVNNDKNLKLVKLSNSWIKSVVRRKRVCEDILKVFLDRARIIKLAIYKVYKRLVYWRLMNELYELFLKLDHSLEILKIEKKLLGTASRSKELGVRFKSEDHKIGILTVLCNTFMYRLCYIRLVKKEIYMRLSIKDNLITFI